MTQLLTTAQGLPESAVRSLAHADDGVLWVGTQNGLARVVQGSVAQVRESPNARVQNLLHRRFEEEEVDPDEYLARLTGEGAPRG